MGNCIKCIRLALCYKRARDERDKWRVQWFALDRDYEALKLRYLRIKEQHS